MLIGNHEAMNITGDLRYVHPGEYQAFTTRNSERYQEMQWQAQVQWMQANLPEFETLDLDVYRQEWEQQVPLGWVEHRQGWSLDGDYGSWVADNQVAVQLNDTIFLHGGISAKYCGFSLQSLTEQVIAGLETFDPVIQTIVTDPLGPLWYRGMATEDEEGVFSLTLDNILKRYGAKRVVIGHTPTGGMVWPRFDGRVVANDTGIAAHYGAHIGILELTAEGAVAIYGDKRIPIPAKNSERMDYLRTVVEADPGAGLVKVLVPKAEQTGESVDDTDAEQPADAGAAVAEAIPGTCQ